MRSKPETSPAVAVERLSRRARNRNRASLLGVATVALTLLVGVAIAWGAKATEQTFGQSGTDGGLFNRPLDVAVNEASDDVYVADSQNNRVERFDADGNFELAWGRDVVKAGEPNDLGTAALEVCDLSNGNVAGDCKQGILGATAADHPGGELNRPTGIEIRQSTGDVYVREGLSLRASVFDQDGNWERTFGRDVIKAGAPNDAATGFEICAVAEGNVAADCKEGAGTDPEAEAAGAFGMTFASVQMTLSQATGDLFFGSSENRRIDQYDAEGDFIRAWGLGVDTGATRFEICTAASTCQAGLNRPSYEAPLDGQLYGSNQPVGLAVDAAGVLYATNGGFGTDLHILRFDTTVSGDDEGAPGSAASQLPLERYYPERPDSSRGWPAGPVPQGAPVDLEVDPGSGNLLVLYARSAGGGDDNSGIGEIDTTTGLLVDTLMQGSGPVVLNGLGVNGSLDTLYVSASALGDRILRLGNNGPPAPTLVVNEPTAVECHSADFSATVTPNGPPGIETYGRIELSENGTDWVPLPDAKGVNLGDGNAPVLLEAAGEGLYANTTYQLRVVGQKTFGAGTTISPQSSFTTDRCPPEVETIFPQSRTDTAARLAGFVNANNLPTTYHFEYGQTTAYELGIAPDPAAPLAGSVAKKVIAEVTGLQPGESYHYRLVATNDEGTVAGDDISFTAREEGSSAPSPLARAYEMVTPPFKATRQTVKEGNPPGKNGKPAMPSLDGNAITWSSFALPLGDDVQFAAHGDRRVVERTADGWRHHTLNSLALPPQYHGVTVNYAGDASSGDLQSFTMSQHEGFPVELIPSQHTDPTHLNPLYTWRQGTGQQGYTPWLTNPTEQVIDAGFPSSQDPSHNESLFNDDGTAMVRWGHFRDLGDDPETAEDEDPSDEQQFSGTAGGSTPYALRAADADAVPAAPRDLVAECTGEETPTQLPNNAAGDHIGLRPCNVGTLTSRRGAVIGGGKAMGGARATALSNDGRRVFFTSPDPAAGGAVKGCVSKKSGVLSDCAPQLYVRQYDGGDNPTVRWISQAQGIGQQDSAELGTGAAFQGASKDGRFVYFKTNSPLTPDDPNGGASITNGVASDGSYDVYRYELPGGADVDPAGGTLTRITAGPGGAGDPNASLPNTEGAAVLDAAPVRFVSDDGRRAYFLTAAPIAGADTTAPIGGATTPGGTAANATAQNLYAFDDTGAEPSWKFIARLPRVASKSATASQLNACATEGTELTQWTMSFLVIKESEGIRLEEGNCFRGTPDGDGVIFFTGARLTKDDDDDAGDIYYYDLERDELVRVSAPPPSAQPFACQRFDDPILSTCNASMAQNDMGTDVAGSGDFARGFGGTRYLNISKEPDGRISVFFETLAAFVPEDANQHWDVYQWRAGRYSLISPGNTADHSFFSGNSVDGRDVFMFTSSRIDPRELDAHDFDIYDARVGGGFPYTPPPTPCNVLGLQCESGATPPPPVPAPATTGPVGKGNVGPRVGRCPKGKARRKGRCVRKVPQRHRQHKRQTHRADGGSK